MFAGAIQSLTHAPERPGANPMIPPGRVGSRSTIEVIHGFERRHPPNGSTFAADFPAAGAPTAPAGPPTSAAAVAAGAGPCCSTVCSGAGSRCHRTLRARVSSMPIIDVGAACPTTSTAAATRIRCTVPHAMSCSAATSLIARFVVHTAPATFTRNRPVNLDRAGSWEQDWVNERRGHNRSAHTNRRLRTHTRNGTSPCGRSFTRRVGRSLITPDSTPHRGHPPSLSTLSASTTRPPSGAAVTSSTRNPGSANSNDVASDMTRGLFISVLSEPPACRGHESQISTGQHPGAAPGQTPRPPLQCEEPGSRA